MRVVHLIDNLRVGGAQKVVVELANWTQRAGHDVAVVAQRGPLMSLLDPDVRFMPAPAPQRALPYLARLRTILSAWQPDLLHAHQRAAAISGRLIGGCMGIPVVEHVHSVLPQANGRLLSYRTKHLVAVGGEVSKMLTEQYNRPRERVSTVWNAVPDQRGGRVPATESRRDGPLRLVAIGRLVTQKDPLRFVSLVRHLLDMGVECQARWVGDGPLRADVERALAEDRLSEHITLVGEDLHVFPHLEWADALVLLSRWEGLPLVVLEAMAASRPVVAKNVGSVEDALSPDTGLLIPAESSVAETAEAIAHWASTMSDLSDAGNSARLRYEQHFAPDISFNRLIDLYGAVLNSRSVQK